MTRIRQWALSAVVAVLLTLSFASVASADPKDCGFDGRNVQRTSDPKDTGFTY